MIRIIAGKHRGKKLPVPAAKDLRPTTDRTRAAMFNLVMHRLPLPVDAIHVLDGFAGSGALGFESLSRGAASVTFVEKNGAVVHHLKKIADGLEGETHVIKADFHQFIRHSKQPFDLIFLDPPFTHTDYDALLANLAKASCLKPGTLVVIERPTKNVFIAPREFAVLVDRAYGRSSIVVAAYEEPEP